MKTMNAMAMACVLLLSPVVVAAAEPAAKAPAAPLTFDTPRKAADALIAAAADYDVAALKAILGPAGVDSRRHRGRGPGPEPG